MAFFPTLKTSVQNENGLIEPVCQTNLKSQWLYIFAKAASAENRDV